VAQAQRRAVRGAVTRQFAHVDARKVGQLLLQLANAGAHVILPLARVFIFGVLRQIAQRRRRAERLGQFHGQLIFKRPQLSDNLVLADQFLLFIHSRCLPLNTRRRSRIEDRVDVTQSSIFSSSIFFDPRSSILDSRSSYKLSLSTNSCTAAADFCKAARSSVVRLIWMISSMPFTPNFIGTPTKRPLTPYSPSR